MHIFVEILWWIRDRVRKRALLYEPNNNVPRNYSLNTLFCSNLSSWRYKNGATFLFDLEKYIFTATSIGCILVLTCLDLKQCKADDFLAKLQNGCHRNWCLFEINYFYMNRSKSMKPILDWELKATNDQVSIEWDLIVEHYWKFEKSKKLDSAFDSWRQSDFASYHILSWMLCTSNSRWDITSLKHFSVQLKHMLLNKIW